MENDFDKGWKAAIEEVKKNVEGYLRERATDKKVDPVEQWLPRLVELLAK
jgi:hypothetical protein